MGLSRGIIRRFKKLDIRTLNAVSRALLGARMAGAADAEVGGSSDFLRYHVRKQGRAGAEAGI